MSTRIVGRVSGRINQYHRRFKDGEYSRVIRFGVVGGSGVIVNEGFAGLSKYVFLLGIADAGLRAQVAILIGIAVSIFTNFVLNDLWTWGDRPKNGRRHWCKRLGLYYSFATIAATVQFLVASSLHVWFTDWPFLLANLVGIAAGVVINYEVNNRITFKSQEN